MPTTKMKLCSQCETDFSKSNKYANCMRACVRVEIFYFIFLSLFSLSLVFYFHSHSILYTYDKWLCRRKLFKNSESADEQSERTRGIELKRQMKKREVEKFFLQRIYFYNIENDWNQNIHLTQTQFL